MSIISKFKLVANKHERNVDPRIQRRTKLASKIDEQLMIAKAQIEGTAYAPKRIKVITNEAGERTTVEVNKRMKEWFWTTSTNKINLSVRYGSKTLELAKGKNAIELSSKSDLVPTLTALKEAVLNGELDEAINSASDKLREGFTK